MDLEDGTVDILADTVEIGATSSPSPVTTSLKFGGGVVDVSSLRLGSTVNTTSLVASVVQKGGVARYGSIILGNAYAGGSTGPNSVTYQLDGGILQVGGISGTGSSAITIDRTIGWSAGTIRGHNSAAPVLINASATAGGRIRFSLTGPGEKAFDIDANRSLTLGDHTELSAVSSDIVLVKRGAGSLVIGGASHGFPGKLRLENGTLGFGYSSITGFVMFTVNAGSFEWEKGALLMHVSSAQPDSDRLALTGTFTKGSGSASSRVFQPRGNPSASQVYTLLTYASTDLTLEDFVAESAATGRATELHIGPTALTATFPAETAYTSWRRSKLSSASNTGIAADLADPDGDGRRNLLEYALGTDPLAIDTTPITVAAVDTVADRLTLTLTRIADPALTYVVRAAAAPSGPWSGEGSQTVFTSTGADNVAGPVTVSDSVALSTQHRRFLRLFVSR